MCAHFKEDGISFQNLGKNTNRKQKYNQKPDCTIFIKVRARKQAVHTL